MLRRGGPQLLLTVRALKPAWIWRSDQDCVAIAERLNAGIRLLGGRFLLRVGFRWRELSVSEAAQHTLVALQQARPLWPDEAALTIHVRVLVCFVLSAFPGRDGCVPLEAFAAFEDFSIEDSTTNEFSNDVVMGDDDDDDDAEIDMDRMF